MIYALGMPSDAQRVEPTGSPSIAELRRKAQSDPETIPALAVALLRLAPELLESGEAGDASLLAQEAAALCGIVAERDAKAAEKPKRPSDPAAAAIDRMQQSAADARILARFHSTYRFNLGETLLELSRRYSENGLFRPGVEVSEEAVDVYRELAERDQNHVPLLAEALTRHALALSHAGQADEGIAPAQDAVALYTQLARVEPNRSHNERAEALTILGSVLSDSGDHEQALAITQEVVELRLNQVERGEVPSTLLANALMEVAERQIEANNPKSAIEPLEDATAIYRLTSNDDRTSARKLAIALMSLGKAQEMMGSPFRALDPIEQASRLLREWVGESQTFRHLFRRCLTQLAELYDRLEYTTEAAATRDEIKLIRQSRRS